MALSAARLRSLRSLATRKGRERHGLFLLEGVRAVEEALRRQAPVEALLHSSGLRDHPSGARLLREAARRGLPREQVRPADLERVCDTVHPQPVAAVIQIDPARLEPALRRADSLLVLLDRVSDPGNVGTVIRSAHAFAAAAVVLGPGCAEPWSPKVVRAAMGSFLALPVVTRPDLGALVTELRERGFRVYGAAGDGEGTYREVEYPPRVALVLGSEAGGISPGVRSRLDGTVRIPMPSDAESLNVAVAAGILLNHVRNGRP